MPLGITFSFLITSPISMSILTGYFLNALIHFYNTER